MTKVDFADGEPNFEPYAFGGKKYNLWEVTGDVRKDERALKELLGPSFKPPDTANTTAGYDLHHGSDGAVMYVPRIIHDKVQMGGAAHTGLSLIHI